MKRQLLEVGAPVLAEDCDMDCTPLTARRFAQFVQIEATPDKQGDYFTVALHQHTTTQERPKGYTGDDLWQVVPGSCSLWISASAGYSKQARSTHLEGWVTTPERVEQLANALLAAVREARRRRLFG